MTFAKWTAVAIAIAMSLGAQAASDTDEKILIKFSHVAAPDTPKGKAANYFKKLAAERTKGRVEVEVYPNSQLYKDKEEMEALQLGAVHILAPAFGKFGPLGVKEFEVFDLPFLFDDIPTAQKVTQGPIGNGLLDKLGDKGIVGLGFWDNAFKQFTANKPLRKPDDFLGQKIRIQSSKVIEAQMRALGASPQVMAFSEIYQALQTGVVDGQENPFTDIYTQKFHEVQKVMTVSSHGYHGYVCIANKAFWDKLPPDIRPILDQAMKETTDFFNKTALVDEVAALDDIKKSGKTEVIVLTAAEKDVLRAALKPVYAEMESRVGAQLIADIQATASGK